MSNSRPGARYRLIAYVCVVAVLSGCAVSFEPVPAEEVPFLERATTQAKDGVTVTVAVPDAAESEALFGVDLYKSRVQPVWLEIENTTTERLSFLPISVDDDYLTPLEVSTLYNHVKARQEMERHFFNSGMHVQIAPGAKRSGFVFSNLDEGTKSFNVDLFGQSRETRFTFFVQVPGLAIDHYEVDLDALYGIEDIRDIHSPADFIAALESLPCCTTGSKGESLGDPLNLVVIGNIDNVYYSFIRSAWDETEVITAESSFKTVKSFLTGDEYRYSPISSLYVFGRGQDIALQKIRDNIHERNHLRLWLTPIRYQGVPVWVGQISRDIGVRFTRKTITTHKIDPDVDETREFLIENLAYAQTLGQLAYVGGVGRASRDNPRQNLTGDPYFSDGLRAVLWLAEQLTDLKDVEYLDWETPDR